MKKIIGIAAVFLLIIGLWVLASSMFVVDETEQVVITEFGKPVGESITEPGLYFKKPFIQSVHFFDNRVLEVLPAPPRRGRRTVAPGRHHRRCHA